MAKRIHRTLIEVASASTMLCFVRCVYGKNSRVAVCGRGIVCVEFAGFTGLDICEPDDLRACRYGGLVLREASPVV